jgi:UDP-2,3-diacylglucosamine pyrophosphatase LpxH
MNYVIISDLHIGANTKLDIFSAQAQLSNFLRSLGGSTTLIINGDFLDFLAVEPYGVFSRVAACEKIDAIVKADSNRVLWDGFRQFLKSDTRNCIEILLGNHDVEMIFSDVQTALRKVMTDEGERERLRFKVDHVSYLHLEVGGVPIHIEHGFQYDPFNWYDHGKLLGSVIHGGRGDSFEIPFGSKLVYDVLNKLTPQHPFVPLIKPEPAVFYMMLALAPREVTSRLRMLPGMVLDNLLIKLHMLRTGQQYDIGITADREAGEEAVGAQLESMLYGGPPGQLMTEEMADSIIEFLETGTGEESRSYGFFSDAKTRGQLYLLRRGLQALQDDRASFFDANQRDEFQKSLERILDMGAKVAILGHSHAMKMLPLRKANDPRRELLYVNTGTWANLLDFDLSKLSTDDDLLAWLDRMDEGSFDPTLVFSCARLEPLKDGGGVAVSLERWRDGGFISVGRETIKH